MRISSTLVQSDGSKRKRASWSLLVMARLCTMDQSTSVSSIILPNQNRRAEFQPAVSGACFFFSSSVGFAAEVPNFCWAELGWLGWATIQGGQVSRLAATGWPARGEPWAGSAEGSGWCEREHVHAQGPRGLCMSGCVVHASWPCSLLPTLPLTRSTPISWLRPFSMSKNRFFTWYSEPSRTVCAVMQATMLSDFRVVSSNPHSYPQS